MRRGAEFVLIHGDMVAHLRRALVLSPEALCFVLVFWMSLFLMPTMLNSDGDLGRHLTVGTWILDHQALPVQDVFSHTRFGQSLVLHEWVSEVLYAGAYHLGNLNGVAWLTALLLAATYAVLAAGLRMLGTSAPMAFAAALGAWLTGAIHHLPRPHLFTLLFFTGLLLVLSLYNRRGWWYGLPVIPFFMALWANVHGAFISGFLLSACFDVGALLERAWRKALVLFGLLGVSILATWLNPAGPALVPFSFGYLQSRFLVDQTVEYASPNFHNLSTYPFAAALAVSLLLGARGRLRTTWANTLLLCLWSLLALYSARNIPLYAQVAAVVLAPAAEAWLYERLPTVKQIFTNLDRTTALASGWAVALLLVVVLCVMEARGVPLDLRGEGNQFERTYFPIAAADKIAADPPPGNMFNEFTWGGYLLYRLFPGQRVFIDGQTDFYGEALTRDYLTIVNAEEGWQTKLRTYDVQWVILPPGRPLASALAASPDWREWYRDKVAVIWVLK